MTAKAQSLEFSYQALQYFQRSPADTPEFFLFHAPADEIRKWAAVDRLAPNNPTGAQRPLRDLKVNKVVRFFSQDKRNTIPTAVVVALDQKSIKFDGKRDPRGNGQHGTLSITVGGGKEKPALIIDGQHRAFGTFKFAGETHLNVVAFVGGQQDERAFQFVVINNTATKVSKDHIKALNLKYDPEKLNKRLVRSAGLSLGISDARYDDLQVIDAVEPFKGQLNWPTNADGFIAPNAIEAGLSETQDRAALLGIEDLEREFFLAIWSRVKRLRSKEWRKHSAAKPCHLLQKVSIYALTVYILESLESVQRMAKKPLDFSDESVLAEYVDLLVERIPAKFWTSPWKATELDTASGRQTLLDALKAIDLNVRYDRPWYEKVHVVDSASLEAAETAAPRKRSKAPQKKK